MTIRHHGALVRKDHRSTEYGLTADQKLEVRIERALRGFNRAPSRIRWQALCALLRTRGAK